MKITFLAPGDGYNGGIRVTMQMANCLLGRGHAVRIAYRKPGSISKRRLRVFAVGVKLRLQGIQETFWLKEFRGIKVPFRKLHHLDFDSGELVLAIGSSNITDLYQLRANVIKVRYCHGIVEEGSEQMRQVWGGPMSTIVVSPGLTDPIQAYSQKRVLGVVPNGISFQDYFVQDTARDGVGFIFSGHPIKGSEVAIGLANALHAKFPQTPCHVFGSYPRPKVLANSEYTRFPTIERARQIYNQCKIWLVTSRDEGFCLPILEAMACGCVVISSRHTNATEIIRDGVNGFTVSYGDIDGYLRIIERLLADDSLCRRIVNEGFNTVKRFTWENAADRMEQVLLRLQRPEGAQLMHENLQTPPEKLLV